jgi:hypothetical protein
MTRLKVLVAKPLIRTFEMTLDLRFLQQDHSLGYSKNDSLLQVLVARPLTKTFVMILYFRTLVATLDFRF